MGRQRMAQAGGGRRAWLASAAVLALLPAGAPRAAAAQGFVATGAGLPQGFYVSAGIGANLVPDTSVQVRGGIAPGLAGSGGTLRLNTLPMGVLALGYGFGNGIRVELEGSLRVNTVDRARGFPAIQPITQAQGQLHSYGAMVNTFVDFDLGPEAWLMPYAGVGVGYLHNDWNALRVGGSSLRLAGDGSDGNFAYQAILGAAVPLAAVPGLSLTAEYRFLGTVSPDFGARLISLPGLETANGRIEAQPYHHSLLLGLRYVPNARPQPVPAAMPAAPMAPPAPLPIPAVVPAPARTFVVFFASASAALNARARDLVAEAAEAARGGGAARIEVTGHTDHTGGAALNQRLSVRRAEAVAAELQRRGVRRGDIVIRGAGFNEPAVPTPPGRAEPQNRRVEIVIR